MNGLELLKQEMQKRGCTKQQCNSKTVAIVLDIICGGDIHTFTDIYEAECKLFALKQAASSQEAVIARNWKLFQEKMETAKDEIKKQTDYIDAFKESLAIMETPEARDALRTAQVFMNSVYVNTKYDNTALINGLGAILSRSGIGDSLLEQLQKLDTNNIKLNSRVWGRITK